MEVGVLFKAFFMIFLAEMGDKSQFLMVAMAAEYRVRDILLGTGSAILFLNLLAVGVGGALGTWLPAAPISLVAGVAFLLFAYLSIAPGGEEAERFQKGKRALPAIFGTYFLAELGDKTQLTTLTLSAQSGAGSPGAMLAVLAGASIALFAADLIGLSVGVLLGKRLPAALFAWLSFLLFALCGILRVLEGFGALCATLPHGVIVSAVFTVLIAFLFLILCCRALCGKKSRERNHHGTTDTSRAKSVRIYRFQ